MTENFEEKLGKLTELLEKQIEAYANLNDTTKKTEEQQKKSLESSILEAKGYKKVNGEIISIEEDRIKAEAKLTQELYDKFGKEKVLNQKIQDEYNKQLKSITDVIKGSIEITDAQKQNLAKLKQSNEYIAAQQASEFKKQAEALGAIVQSNGKLLEVNNKIITDSIKLSDEQKKQLAAAKMAQDPGKAVGDMANRYKDTSNTLTDFSNKLQESASSSVGWTSTIQLAEAAISGMAKGITVFTSSIYKGERGATVTANALNELTKSVGDTMTGIGTAFAIFSWFMPGGAIVKGLKIVGGLLGVLGGQLIKGYGELQKLGAEQNDALFKAYNRLSASGLGAAKGLEGVIDTVHTLNMSVPEIEKFTELLTNNSKELKLLGATAGEGAQNFAKVAGELSKSKIGEQLERLGVTAEEQREHTLRYMVNQTRMGLAQGKTQQELIRGSQQYIEELDKVAMLTGASRKTQEEARAAVMAENELRAAIYEAKKNKDFALVEKLEQAAELAKNLKIMGDTRGMTGVSKYAAAGFNPTDEVSGAAMLTFQEALTNISQGKGGSASDNLTTALKGLQTSMDNYAGAAKFGGDFKPLQTADMATAADMVGIKESFDEKRKQDPNKSTNDILTEIQNARKTADERLTATVEGNRMQQAAAQIMDKAAFQYNDAAKIHAAASTKFKEAVDTFAKVVGAKPVAGGTNVNSGTSAPQPAPAPPNAGALQMGGMADQRRQGLGGASQGIPTPLPSNLTPKGRGISSSTPDNTHATPSGGGTGDNIKLSSISSKSGKSTQVGAAYASQFQQLVDYLDTTGYEIRSLGGYIDRDVRGKPGVKSVHAHGGAIDINPDTNPMGGNLVTDMPADISSIAKSLGLGWGGNWNSRKDAMHFSAAMSEGGTLLKARNGGIFNGPTSGYDVQLHGREAIVPLPNPNSIISVNEGVKKESVTTAMQDLGSTSSSTESPSAILQELLSLMENKFDAMISQLSTGNDISDKLLRNSMV